MNLNFQEIFIKESHWKSKKVYKKRKKIYKSTEKRGKNSWKIGRPIFALLPTPLVRFCPILSHFAWPPSPPKIGHHLCTFPKYYRCLLRFEFHTQQQIMYTIGHWSKMTLTFISLTKIRKLANKKCQIHFPRSKNSQICPNLFSAKNIILGDQHLSINFLNSFFKHIIF